MIIKFYNNVKIIGLILFQSTNCCDVYFYQNQLYFKGYSQKQYIGANCSLNKSIHVQEWT